MAYEPGTAYLPGGKINDINRHYGRGIQMYIWQPLIYLRQAGNIRYIYQDKSRKLFKKTLNLVELVQQLGPQTFGLAQPTVMKRFEFLLLRAEHSHCTGIMSHRLRFVTPFKSEGFPGFFLTSVQVVYITAMVFSVYTSFIISYFVYSLSFKTFQFLVRGLTILNL